MRAPASTYLFLAVGLIAASQSGNLIRLGRAPAIVMAAWRLLFASLILFPLAGAEIRTLRTLTFRERALVVGAGIALAAHLTTWIAAVQMTTVANAAIFFAVNPVLTALAAWFVFGERPSTAVLLAAGLGLLGLALIGWNDFALDSRHLAGDAVALLCSAFFTVYFLAGKRVRQVLSTRIYVATMYGVAGLACFALIPALGHSAIQYDARTWLCFLLLAVVPTVLGHTSLNHALKHLEAGWVSCATLTEPPLAAVVAYFAWEEIPSSGALVGYVVISLSVLLLLWDTQRRRKRETG